ncbi:MAG: hypothetical protein R3310_02575 [Candidatus Competibacteraceae bacterium]|nr:hypothetical protein [Candidatus Competibacteraceae bacterium]
MDSQSPRIIEGRHAHPAEVALLESFRQELPKQVERCDDLAKELLKLELAIAGIGVCPSPTGAWP